MILHIPHSSTQTLDYTLNNKNREILRMTDWYTDDLYQCKDATSIKFGLSRLICDVERFENDKEEYMSRFGMGVCYKKDTEGNILRKVTFKDKINIIKNYYRPHHKKLSDEVEKELKNNNSSLIIDCHSFPDISYYFNSDYNQKRPDICIGTDDYHTPKELLQKIKVYFLAKGYVVQVNAPYTGTIVPLKYYKRDKRVSSIMIELNRKLYIDENGFKTEHYDILKDEISELLCLLSK